MKKNLVALLLILTLAAGNIGIVNAQQTSIIDYGYRPDNGNEFQYQYYPGGYQHYYPWYYLPYYFWYWPYW